MTAKIGFSPLKGPDAGELGSGLGFAYVENLIPLTINTSAQTVMPFTVTTSDVSIGVCGINLQGIASGILTLRINVMHGSTVADSFLVTMQAGNWTIGIPFILPGIPAETGNWSLELHTSSGTFSIDPNKASWWIESGAITGGLSATDPSQFVHDSLAYQLITGDSAIVTLQTPTLVSAADSYDYASDETSDTVGTSAGMSILGVAAEDGWVSTVPSITTSTTALQAGNSAGEVRAAFMRFALPSDLSGRTMVRADITVYLDANISTVPILVWRADTDTTPDPIASKADFDARVRTSAGVAWSPNAPANTSFTVNIKPLFDELVALGTPFTAVMILLDDASSPTDGVVQFRSADSLGPAPLLVVQYQ